MTVENNIVTLAQRDAIDLIILEGGISVNDDNKRKAVTFTFTEEALHDLDQMMEEEGFPNRAELVRQALRFLEWTRQEVRGGAKLFLEKNEVAREIIFPFWDYRNNSEQTDKIIEMSDDEWRQWLKDSKLKMPDGNDMPSA